MAVFDLKVVNGRVIDGTGAPATHADVAIVDGEIAAVGSDLGAARRTIDAADSVVAPGFIDIHTHLDAQLLWDRRASPASWHGVTTVVTGNCGFGFAPATAADRGFLIDLLESVEGMPAATLHAGLGSDWGFETFPEYLDALDRAGPAVNVAALVPHSALRTFVLGEEACERASTAREVELMPAQLHAALQAGAAGLSTSRYAGHQAGDGRPAPSCLAGVEEPYALCRVLTDERGGILMAMGFSISDLRTLAEEVGCRVTFANIRVAAGGHPEGHLRLLDELHAARQSGVDITAQAACMPLTKDFDLSEPRPLCSSAPLANGLPSLEDVFLRVTSARGKDEVRAAYRDPSFIEEFERRTSGDEWRDRIWRRVRVALCPSDPSLEQQPIVELAEKSDLSPAAALIKVGLLADLGTRFTVEVLNLDEDAVGYILQQPGVQLALSDAGAHVREMCDASFSSHLLRRWVREREEFTLERAVQMLSADPAQLYNLRRRGQLCEGFAADVTIFDPESIGPTTPTVCRDLPGGAPRVVVDAVGVDHVIVNGVVIRSHGEDVSSADPLPGRVLRRSDYGISET